MRGLNKVMLIGNLGADPEVRRLESGAVVAQFRIATTETYKDKSGNRAEQTEWHNIVVWNKLAEVAEKYLKKGSSVYVEGRIRSREYTDKNNIQRRAFEIVANTFQMLDRKPEGAAGGGGVAAAEADTVTDEPMVDDLPF